MGEEFPRARGLLLLGEETLLLPCLALLLHDRCTLLQLACHELRHLRALVEQGLQGRLRDVPLGELLHLKRRHLVGPEAARTVPVQPPAVRSIAAQEADGAQV